MYTLKYTPRRYLDTNSKLYDSLNCDQYHNNPYDLILSKNGKKIDYELFALEDSTNKTEEKEYGYIIKSKNEKLTNENMGFMF